ncbi:MAG: CPBP family intramembrane glutamic endopeptidase [Dysgonomonas sp.]|nr:CPBP family intramembrane glutamic endopeptidase [Dysgonomonas sp.]
MDALRPIWKFISYNYKFGLFLILLFGIPRFLLVLDANSSGGYGYVSIMFILMWFTPFIFFTKDGRRQIGFKKPANKLWLIYSFLIGFAFCAIMFIGANLLFGDTINNSFNYISRTYTIPAEALETNKFLFFMMFSFIGMTFSPIGEEFLYRGVVHGSFVEQFGERKASLFDSLAFALTHLAHFGIVFNMGEWTFLPVPALLWVLGMFIASQLFFLCKQFSESILGAVICHAGYNIGMMYFIFYHIF